MALMDSAQFVRLMDKRLRMVREDALKELPTMLPMFYNMLPSDAAFEEFYSVGAVPDIPYFNGYLQFLNIVPGFHLKIEHKEFAAGLRFERKLVDDKKYNVLDSQVAGLEASSQRTREKYGARAFGYAFSTAYDFISSHEEGVALCSSSHSTKASTSTASGFDNAGSSAMSKTSIGATRVSMRKFKNDEGQRIDMGDDLCIVCPDSLADTAMEAVGSSGKATSQLDPTTAQHRVNVNYGRYDVISYPRLDDIDANNWFMVWKSQMKKDLIWMDRISPESHAWRDEYTFALLYSVYLRFSYGWLDWRWIYGHQVT